MKTNFTLFIACFIVLQLTAQSGFSHNSLPIAKAEKIVFSTDNSIFTASFNNNEILIKGDFEATGSYMVSVYSLIGEKIFNNLFLTTGNEVRCTLNREVPAGIYILKIKNVKTNEDAAIKIVKQ